MMRRLKMVAFVCVLFLPLGCADEEKVNNPNNLEYNKEGPPPRGGPGAPQIDDGGNSRIPKQPK